MTSLSSKTTTGLALLILALSTSWVAAQEENERLASSIPLEASIAGRDVAYRWRWEVQDTEGSTLVEEDPALAYYPARMVTTELKALGVNGGTAFIAHDQWRNDQNLDVFRSSVGGGFPVGDNWRLDLKGSYFDKEDFYDSQYYYLAAGRSFGNFYFYPSYRLSLEGKTPDNGFIQGHQLNQYLSWNPTKTFRMGVQGGYCKKENDDDAGYVRVFLSKSLFDYGTSVRLEALDYESKLYANYREYRTFLYQKLNVSTLARVGYRYYTDDMGHYSHGPGVKLIHFFSPRVSAHIGYVHYVQGAGIEFDSYLAGMNVIF